VTSEEKVEGSEKIYTYISKSERRDYTRKFSIYLDKDNIRNMVIKETEVSTVKGTCWKVCENGYM